MCLESIERVHVGCLEGVQGVSQVGLEFISYFVRFEVFVLRSQIVYSEPRT